MKPVADGCDHAALHRICTRVPIPLLVLLWVLFAILTAAPARGADKVRYSLDIRPILAENCFACHGPDAGAREAELRLDEAEAAHASEVLSPGEPDESELLRRIFSEDEYEVMPPPDSHKQLTDAQKELLRRWIAEGAEYEPHWSFIPPTRPALPAVEHDEWVRNPIDHFILARLEAAGLQPAPEADRYTLARRLSLDLTGLPPSAEEVREFVADSSPDYYERYVDKLLASPHWGEHRGRYWLDAARYADTHGIHFDNYREIWAYRDWVIKAFNRNQPFDQFTIEQLAGDLLPEPSLEQLVATGFNRCNITTNEGGVIAEEYLVLYTRDRTETTSRVWMGLTANCAVCHDHKFDPLTQREFYEMAAFFNNTTQEAMDRNIKDTPPVLPVPPEEDRERWFALETEIPAARESVEARRREARPEHEQWVASATSEGLNLSIAVDALHLHAPLRPGHGHETRLTVDGTAREITLSDSAQWQSNSVGNQVLQLQGSAAELADVGDFELDQPFTCASWIELPPNDASGAIVARMDETREHRGWDFWTQRRQVGMHLIHRWPEDALKVVAKEQIEGNRWTHVAVTYDGSGKASGVKVYYDGKPQELSVENDKLQSSPRIDVPLKIGSRHGSAPISAAKIQDLRIYTRVLSEGEVETLAKNSRLSEILDQPAEARSEEDKEELYNWWLGALDEEYQQRAAHLESLEREQADIRARGTIAHIVQERDEEPKAYVLYRGEYDQRRDEVGPGTPAILPPFPEDAPRNRLGFARWLLLPEHPLTARVTVNRFWQEVFGNGLVRTPGDFGIAGELPSHPELLDWLAVEFREGGWDVKQFFKLLVTSATYRQSAVATPEKLEQDPENVLLSRGPRFRMDAEMIRDYALASSGLLVRKLGGPSVKPYQPDGFWEAVAMIGSNTRNYERDSGENLYRRSLYTFWKRSAPPASMDIFNAPNRETCTVSRERTNTPLQALVTLNDVQFVEAARHLAQRALREGGDTDEARLEYIALRLLSRPLRTEEVEIARASLADLAAYYTEHPSDAAEVIAFGESPADSSLEPPTLAAWTMLVNQLMNLDEVLNK